MRRVQVLGGREVALPARTATCDGYNLNAGVSVAGSAGLERLCWYMLRPPLAKERIEQRPDGTVVIGMKRVWSDGTSAIELTPSEFVEKLAALVPCPRSNTILYRGVLAANAAWRKEVIPMAPEDRAARDEARRELSRPAKIKVQSERIPWAELSHRVFGVDAHRCPGCGGRLVLRCVVLGPAAAKIPAGLQRAARARAPP